MIKSCSCSKSWSQVIFLSVFAFLCSNNVFAAESSAITEPATIAPTPVALQVESLQISSPVVKLPALELKASLKLQNVSDMPVTLQRSSLRFWSTNSEKIDERREVTREVLCEPVKGNVAIVPPNESVELNFWIQLFHDAPQGTLDIKPSVKWEQKKLPAPSQSTVALSAGTEDKSKATKSADLKPAKPQRGVIDTLAEPITLVVQAPDTNNLPLVWLGDERPQPGTGGEWIGRYGNASFVLSGMDAPQDMVGGRLLPRRRWEAGKTGFAPTTPLWADWKGEFFYETFTGEGQETRHWIPPDKITTDDLRALRNPMEGGRRFPSWDDMGETRPYEKDGPDLVVQMEIPKGVWRLALYFIDWDHYGDHRPRVMRYFIYDTAQKMKAVQKLDERGLEPHPLLSSGYLSDLKEGVYKVYGVVGPRKLRLRVHKVNAINAVMSGIFLDEVKLPDITRAGLPPQAKQSTSVQDAASLYRTLRQQSEKSPIAFINSQEQMRRLLLAANKALLSNNQAETAAAEWMRWQCAASLIVDPKLKEEALVNFMKWRPSGNARAARQRVQGLMDIGEIGLARRAVPIWLEEERRSHPASELAGLWEAIVFFSKRDTDFAITLCNQLAERAKAQELPVKPLLESAQDMNDLAQQDQAGPLRLRNGFRVVAAFYQAIEKTYGAQSLGDTGKFLLAEALGNFAGYRFAAEKKAILAYQEYLTQWPNGAHAARANFNIVQLVGKMVFGGSDQSQLYADIGNTSAEALLTLQPHVRVFNRNSVSGARSSSLSLTNHSKDTYLPLSVAFNMGEIYSRIGNKAQANRWYKEVANRVPTDSPMAQLIKKKVGN